MILDFIKQFLTLLGARLSNRMLLQFQAAINYLRLGRWMTDHKFSVNQRARGREETWQVVADQVHDRKVLYLEFGVASGASMVYWSRSLKHPESTLHGFDSFEGLPESGGAWSKGQFDCDGKIPEIVDPRVRFFKGWFEHILPTYSVPSGHEVIIINMDADLYSSTIYVLRSLQSYIRPGTFIYFDEMPHMEHEPRAFDEFIDATGRQFKLVSADKSLTFVFFECIG